MNNIKIVPNLQPWEVMKRASEGELVAHNFTLEGEPVWQTGLDPIWNWNICDYAIIDTTTPQIDWGKFDWSFFNQYGGLPVKSNTMIAPGRIITSAECPQLLKLYAVPGQYDEDCELTQSPFYYWPGGKQPVPDNVEVELVCRVGDTVTHDSVNVPWSHKGFNNDIIAFRITGNVS